MPKISVIMPVYNGELFLEESIGSLLTQSFQDWELIVVDDGSRDRTPQILSGYTDPRIKVFQQSNRGEAGARNTGLRQMTGEYMAFLDADDMYFPNALQDLSSFLDNNPQFDSVFSNGYIFDQDGQQLMTLTDVRPGIHTGNILNPLVLTPTVITVPVCTMTRISKIREHGLYFDEHNNLIGTDWDYWIRLAVHATFGYLDKVTCKYRIHTTNITRTTGAEKRRKDELYRRTKILNADWFGSLSIHTRELFFVELITRILAGDISGQHQVMQSQQFAGLPSHKQADLWRMVGIDALKGGCDTNQVRSYLLESQKLNPVDRKTRLLLTALHLGKPVALGFVNLWHVTLETRRKAIALGNPRTEHLQKLLGIK